MNKDNIPTSDRYAMFDADMMDQLTDSLTDSEYRDFSRAYDEKTAWSVNSSALLFFRAVMCWDITVPQQSSRAARVILPTVPPCCAGIKIPSKTLWGR